MSVLELCDGPECPACGCRDTQVDERPGRWGGPRMLRYVCNYCGYAWNPQRWAKQEGGDQGPEAGGQGPEESDGPVIYHVLRCPKCKSTNHKILSSPKPKRDNPRVRYHECKDCEHHFKSVER